MPKTNKFSLPWDHNDNGLINGQVSDPDGDDEAPFIADTATESGMESKADKARAEFIVKAANSYHPMVEALEFYFTSKPWEKEGWPKKEFEKMAREAIAIAKGV